MSKHWFSINSELLDILDNDKYDDFLKLSKEDILNKINISTCIHTNRKKCREDSIATVIFKHNIKRKNNICKISEYAVFHYNINSEAMTELMSKYKFVKKSLIVKCIFMLNLTDLEMNSIFQKILLQNDWIICDLLHMLNYKLIDINKVINKIPYSRIPKLLELNYKLNMSSIMLLILKYNIYDSSSLAKLGFCQKMITDKKNSDIIIKLFGKGSVELVKFIEKNEFVVTQECLHEAVINLNFKVISLLLSKNMVLTDDDCYALFFKNKNKKNKNKNKKVSRYRRNSWKTWRKIRKYSNIISKVNNYEENMINLIENTSNKILNSIQNKIPNRIPNKILDETFGKYLMYLLNSHCFKLANVIAKKINCDIKHILEKYSLYRIVRDIIQSDNLDSLKKLFESKIVLPIEISVDTNYMNMALFSNSTKIINYFHDDLKMVCSPNVHQNLDYHRVKNKDDMIKNLIRFSYPINDAFIRAILRVEKFKVIEYLMEKKYQMPSFVVDYAILSKKYKIANKILESVKISKRGYINKMINMNCTSAFNSYKKGCKLNSKKQFQYMINLGCTFTTNNKNRHIKLYDIFALDTIMIMHELFGYEPRKEEIISMLSNYRIRYSGVKSEKIIEFLEYFKDICKIFADGSFNGSHENICEYVSRNVDTNLPLLKYILKESKTKLSKENIVYMFGRIYSSCSYNKFFDFCEENDVVINKNFLISNLRDMQDIAVTHIIKRYNIKVSLFELHNEIATKRLFVSSIVNIFDALKIEMTPYTIKLVINTMYGWGYKDYVVIILSKCGILQETYDKIMSGVNIRVRNYVIKNKNKIKVVEYDPLPEEIVDENIIVNHDIDDDYSYEKIDKDYVEEILDEYKVN